MANFMKKLLKASNNFRSLHLITICVLYFVLLDPGANTKVIAYLLLQWPLQNQTPWAAQQSLTYGWQAEERLHQWLMVIWFWFMASNELCFTLKSINNWPLDEGGRESLAIIHSWLYQPFTHMHAYSHKQSGFTVAVETIQTGVNALQIIWRVCVYRSTTGRKEGREAVCYLCGCIVAHCGGVILQVAGRLTTLHRLTVRRKSN